MICIMILRLCIFKGNWNAELLFYWARLTHKTSDTNIHKLYSVPVQNMIFDDNIIFTQNA